MFAVQFSPSFIRAAAAKRSGKNLAVHARAEQSLAKGVLARGGITKSDKVQAALEKLKTSLGLKRGRVTLCLSPRTVYTTLVRVPVVHGSKLKSAVYGELEAVLPEHPDDMKIRFSPVRKDELGMRIAVMAVRKHVIEEYEALFHEAHLRVAGITTSGLALGDMVKADSFVLINAQDPEPSLIVFYGKKPIDELLLSSVAAKTVVEELTALLEEYAQDGMPLSHVAVHGTAELAEKVKAALQPKKAAKDKKEELSQTVTVEHLLSNLEKADAEWAGLIISSLGKGHDVREGYHNASSTQYALMVLFLLAAGYFVWSVGSVQILGFWSEIMGL